MSLGRIQDVTFWPQQITLLPRRHLTRGKPLLTKVPIKVLPGEETPEAACLTCQFKLIALQHTSALPEHCTERARCSGGNQDMG